MGAIVQVNRVSFQYLSRAQKPGDDILRDFSMAVDFNEIVAMVGPSACGKSTVGRLVAGLLKPTSGEILFNGLPITGPCRERGLIAQGDWCLPWMTARENILLGLREPERTGPIDRLVDLAGLRTSLDLYPAELSFGARQRVCLVRALVAGASLLVLDEPLSSIDAVLRIALQQSIRQTLKAANVSGLWITHDLDEALLVADRIIIVGDRPLLILDQERVQRGIGTAADAISDPGFQQQRISLQRKVMNLWPKEGNLRA